MVGFGFMDNVIMITAGDAIDSHLGSVLHLSTLAAAALGNLMSDIAGLGMGGTIEGLARRIGLQSPGLSTTQRNMKSSRITHSLSTFIGITSKAQR